MSIRFCFLKGMSQYLGSRKCYRPFMGLTNESNPVQKPRGKVTKIEIVSPFWGIIEFCSGCSGRHCLSSTDLKRGLLLQMPLARYAVSRLDGFRGPGRNLNPSGVNNIYS